MFSFSLFCFFYNNESHFVITKNCLNALRSHTLPHIYLREFSIPKYKNKSFFLVNYMQF